MAKNQKTPKTINASLLAVAPDVPPSEIDRLRRQIDRALVNPKYPVVVNYPVRIQTLSGANNPTRKFVLVCAPDIPCVEVKNLRKHVIKAMKDPSYCVVTNYACTWEECWV